VSFATITRDRGMTRLTWDEGSGRVGAVQAPDGGTLAYSYQGALRTGTTWAGEVSGLVSRTLNVGNVRRIEPVSPEIRERWRSRR